MAAGGVVSTEDGEGMKALRRRLARANTRGKTSSSSLFPHQIFILSSTLTTSENPQLIQMIEFPHRQVDAAQFTQFDVALQLAAFFVHLHLERRAEELTSVNSTAIGTARDTRPETKPVGQTPEGPASTQNSPEGQTPADSMSFEVGSGSAVEKGKKERRTRREAISGLFTPRLRINLDRTPSSPSLSL